MSNPWQISTVVVSIVIIIVGLTPVFDKKPISYHGIVRDDLRYTYQEFSIENYTSGSKEFHSDDFVTFLKAKIDDFELKGTIHVVGNKHFNFNSDDYEEPLAVYTYLNYGADEREEAFLLYSNAITEGDSIDGPKAQKILNRKDLIKIEVKGKGNYR